MDLAKGAEKNRTKPWILGPPAGFRWLVLGWGNGIFVF